MNEDRYEALELIVKVRPDGERWIDIIFDLLASGCEGNIETGVACTCGTESMAGMVGTLEECYRWQGLDDEEEQPW